MDKDHSTRLSQLIYLLAGTIAISVLVVLVDFQNPLPKPEQRIWFDLVVVVLFFFFTIRELIRHVRTRKYLNKDYSTRLWQLILLLAIAVVGCVFIVPFYFQNPLPKAGQHNIWSGLFIVALIMFFTIREIFRIICTRT